MVGQEKLNQALPAEQRAKLLGGEAYPLFSFEAWERAARETQSIYELALKA